MAEKEGGKEGEREREREKEEGKGGGGGFARWLIPEA